MSKRLLTSVFQVGKTVCAAKAPHPKSEGLLTHVGGRTYRSLSETAVSVSVRLVGQPGAVRRVLQLAAEVQEAQR